MEVIGNEGLIEAKLILPQATTRTFDIVHTTEEGTVIDHSSSIPHMAFQYKDKKLNKKITYNLDSCCSCLSDKIRVTIPANITETLPLVKMKWDIILETALGEQIRMIYGDVEVVDTYALDDETE